MAEICKNTYFFLKYFGQILIAPIVAWRSREAVPFGPHRPWDQGRIKDMLMRWYFGGLSETLVRKDTLCSLCFVRCTCFRPQNTIYGVFLRIWGVLARKDIL